MELSEIYNKRVGKEDIKPKISFEVFPPKSGDISNLFEQLRLLKRYNPVLVSLTYGASGALNRFTKADIKSIRDLDFTLMPHFTCVSMLKNEIEDYITSIENLGIENILALRGDIPEYLNQEDLDFRHADELVDFIHTKTTLSIGVAGYPEGHIESCSLVEDIKYLKQKIDKGACTVFTQLFYNNSKFFRYVDNLRNNGINIPVVAGIMPIRSIDQIKKMTSMARVTLPKKLTSLLEKYPDDIKKVGIEYVSEQCEELLKNSVDGLHFFILNHSDLVSEILDNIL